jgi:hypothetical protein
METREIPFSGVGIRLGDDDLHKFTYENRRKFQCKVDLERKLAVIGPCINFTAPIPEEYIGKTYDKEEDVFVLQQKSMNACGCSAVEDDDLEAGGVDITQFYKTLGFNKNQKDNSAVFNFPSDVLVASSTLLANKNSLGSEMLMEPEDIKDSNLPDDSESSSGTKSSKDSESEEGNDSIKDDIESEEDQSINVDKKSLADGDQDKSEHEVSDEEDRYLDEEDDYVGNKQEKNDRGGKHVPTKRGHDKIFRCDDDPEILESTEKCLRKLKMMKSQYRPGVEHKFVSLFTVADKTRQPKKARR